MDIRSEQAIWRIFYWNYVQLWFYNYCYVCRYTNNNYFYLRTSLNTQHANTHTLSDVCGRSFGACRLRFQRLWNHQERLHETSESYFCYVMEQIANTTPLTQVQRCSEEASKGHHLPTDYQLTALTGGKQPAATFWAYPLSGVLEFLIPYSPSVQSSASVSEPSETPSEHDGDTFKHFM